MKVLVCGGRDYADSAKVDRHLTALMPTTIVHGAARGVDTLADKWAGKWKVPVHRYPADWGLYGRVAGPIRNQRMLDIEQPDLVLAFPGGKGTADMIRRAKAAGFQVVKVEA